MTGSRGSLSPSAGETSFRESSLSCDDEPFRASRELIYWCIRKTKTSSISACTVFRDADDEKHVFSSTQIGADADFLVRQWKDREANLKAEVVLYRTTGPFLETNSRNPSLASASTTLLDRVVSCTTYRPFSSIAISAGTGFSVWPMKWREGSTADCCLRSWLPIYISCYTPDFTH